MESFSILKIKKLILIVILIQILKQFSVKNQKATAFLIFKRKIGAKLLTIFSSRAHVGASGPCLRGKCSAGQGLMGQQIRPVRGF